VISVSVQPQAGGAAVSLSTQCPIHYIGPRLDGSVDDETYECASRGETESQFWSMLHEVAEKRAAKAAAVPASTGCTVEQILKMKDAQLTDAQITTACD
jgi:hypothetical protein